MRSLLVLTILVPMIVAAFPASPVDATGGSQTYRLLTHGDYYFGPMSFGFCPSASNELTTDPECWLLKDQLGYDGYTSALVDWGATGHLDHAFSCAVTSSATGIIGNSLPFPANMVHGDSIAIGFDRNGDTLADTQYGGRGIQPQPAWITIYLQHALASGDPNEVVGAFTRYAGEVHVSGPTPSIQGNVDGAISVLWNEATDDVTIDCVF